MWYSLERLKRLAIVCKRLHFEDLVELNNNIDIIANIINLLKLGRKLFELDSMKRGNFAVPGAKEAQHKFSTHYLDHVLYFILINEALLS